MWAISVAHIFLRPFSKVVVRLPVELAGHLDELAVKRRASRSAVVASLVATHPALADWRATAAPDLISRPFAEHVAGIPRPRRVVSIDDDPAVLAD